MRKLTKGIGSIVATMTIAATVATTNADAASYTVKSGDTLGSIANKYNTTVGSLQAKNGLSGHLIYPGQTLDTPSVKSSVSRGYFNWPAAGATTSGYGYRSSGMHKGIDIANSTGTPIKAAASGKVTRSGYSSSYGNVVYIYHPAFNKTTVYAHLSHRNVYKGQRVSAGQKIGGMGQTGQAYGSHLHFEVHNGGWDYKAGINPMPYLR